MNSLTKIRHMIFLASILGGALLSTASFAQSPVESPAEPDWGLDLRAEREHQTFDETDADLTTITIQPYVQVGNWDISMSLQWQSIEGEYFVNGFQPNPSRICERLSDLNLLQRQVLVNRGRITQDQFDYCDSQTGDTVIDDSVSGMSDISLFARYLVPLDRQGVWLGSVGLGYKFDNGDEDSGIGSGTKDTTLDFSVNALSGNWISYLAAGYVWISGGAAFTGVDENDNEIRYGYDNYAYATIDSGYKFTDWLTVGANANVQQAYISGGDDVKWLGAYAAIKFQQKFRLRAYMNDYLDIVGYPEHEIGASITYSF